VDYGNPPTGGLCLPAGKHTGILTYIQTLSTKKRSKSNLFLVKLFPIEIRTLYYIISLNCAEFLVLTGIEGL